MRVEVQSETCDLGFYSVEFVTCLLLLNQFKESLIGIIFFLYSISLLVIFTYLFYINMVSFATVMRALEDLCR